MPPFAGKCKSFSFVVASKSFGMIREQFNVNYNALHRCKKTSMIKENVLKSRQYFEYEMIEQGHAGKKPSIFINLTVKGADITR